MNWLKEAVNRPRERDREVVLSTRVDAANGLAFLLARLVDNDERGELVDVEFVTCYRSLRIEENGHAQLVGR